MVYGFVKQSGGHVQVRSKIGSGTSVGLFLPAVTAPQPNLADAAPASNRVPSASGEAILVVEDDARVRRVTVARLVDAGYTILEASNAAEALARLAAHPEIRLVFTDVIMPGGMSGDELARQVRLQHPKTKILFASGFAEPAVARREQAVARNWLSKPYSTRDLTTKVRELLGQVP
jgi:CheY-like chemotaxis protein